ncbi:MAG: hypothetical protein LBL34_03720 [Clostridiales bacterium]|jgi:hypothetical protein|nr:hypothetical protein [Clostridiales bacterium]
MSKVTAKKGFLVKHIKRTSKRKKRIAILIFIVMLLQVLGQLSNLFAIRDISPEQRTEWVNSLVETGMTLEEAEQSVDVLIENGREIPEFDPYATVLFGVVGAWSVWLWKSCNKSRKKPYTNKIFRAFAREGGELDNYEQFEKEISVYGLPEFPNLIVTENWIFYNGYLILRLRNLAEIVCVFQTKTMEKTVLTRWATKKRDVIIGFADKKQWNVRFGKKRDEIEEFKKLMREKLPNIVCGDDDKETAIIWQRQPDKILEKVAENKYHRKNMEEKQKKTDAEKKVDEGDGQETPKEEERVVRLRIPDELEEEASTEGNVESANKNP